MPQPTRFLLATMPLGKFVGTRMNEPDIVYVNLYYMLHEGVGEWPDGTPIKRLDYKQLKRVEAYCQGRFGLTLCQVSAGMTGNMPSFYSTVSEVYKWASSTMR